MEHYWRTDLERVQVKGLQCRLFVDCPIVEITSHHIMQTLDPKILDRVVLFLVCFNGCLYDELIEFVSAQA